MQARAGQRAEAYVYCICSNGHLHQGAATQVGCGAQDVHDLPRLSDPSRAKCASF